MPLDARKTSFQAERSFCSSLDAPPGTVQSQSAHRTSPFDSTERSFALRQPSLVAKQFLNVRPSYTAQTAPSNCAWSHSFERQPEPVAERRLLRRKSNFCQIPAIYHRYVACLRRHLGVTAICVASRRPATRRCAGRASRRPPNRLVEELAFVRLTDGWAQPASTPNPPRAPEGRAPSSPE